LWKFQLGHVGRVPIIARAIIVETSQIPENGFDFSCVLSTVGDVALPVLVDVSIDTVAIDDIVDVGRA
jgi:hypothetical protein